MGAHYHSARSIVHSNSRSIFRGRCDMGGLENKDQTKRVCLRHGKRRKLPVVQPGIPYLVEAGHVYAFLRACLFAQVAQIDRFHHRMPARRNVALDGAEEGGVAKHTAQGVDGEGTAFVHAVVRTSGAVRGRKAASPAADGPECRSGGGPMPLHAHHARARATATPRSRRNPH